MPDFSKRKKGLIFKLKSIGYDRMPLKYGIFEPKHKKKRIYFLD